MSSTKKVVVPLDGSALAERALPYGVALARLEQVSLLLLRIEPENEATSKVVGAIVQAEALNYLELVRKEISQEGLPNRLPFDQIEIQMVGGRSPHELGAILNSLEVSQVVMTTHGRTGLSRFFMGSIAREAVEQLQVPVILIRPQAPEASSLPMELMYQKTGLPKPGETITEKIAVALDGTPEAEVVLQPALELSKALGLGLVLLKVVPDFNPLTDGVNYSMVEEIHRRKIDAWHYLEAVRTGLDDPAVNITLKVLIGQQPAPAILEYAVSDEGNIVMLAMASHTRNRLARLVQGSIAEQVMDESHLPVLMVHRN
jgi:nucleotide-binding universal stress UspA family protein